MRGDAFIHFVSGSRRVNIRLGVFLLIPKSPQSHKKGKTQGKEKFQKTFMYRGYEIAKIYSFSGQ